MGRELEFKFQASEAVFGALMERFGKFDIISMETTYYDTPDLKLAMHHWMLRQRLENSVSVCTFKRPLDDGSRAEWEVECGNPMEAVMLLCRKGAPWELMRCTSGGLMQICGAKFTRLAKTLALPECTVELAMDTGLFLGRGKEQPFMELEIEYKEGNEEAASRFARSLAEDYALVPEERSKVQRAMALMF